MFFGTFTFPKKRGKSPRSWLVHIFSNGVGKTTTWKMTGNLHFEPSVPNNKIWRFSEWGWLNLLLILELPPTQDSSHHQDDIPFLVGNPYKPSFVTLADWEVDWMLIQTWVEIDLLNFNPWGLSKMEIWFLCKLFQSIILFGVTPWTLNEEMPNKKWWALANVSTRLQIWGHVGYPFVKFLGGFFRFFLKWSKVIFEHPPPKVY